MPVNTSDSLGQYCRFAIRPSESVLNELLTGTAMGGTAGTTETIGSDLAYKPASTATTWAIVETDLDPRVGGDFTFFWYGVLPADTAQTIMDCSGTSYGWNLMVGTWGPNLVALDFGTKWGGANQVAISTSTDSVTPIAICAVYTDADRTVKLYKNGTLIKTGLINYEAGVMGANQKFSTKGDPTKPLKTITMQAFAGAFSSTDVTTLSSSPFKIFSAPPLSLIGSNCTQGNAASTPVVSVQGALAPASCAQSNTCSTAAVTRTQALTGSNCTQANATSTVSVNPYTRLLDILATTPLHEWVQVNLNSFYDVPIPTANLPTAPNSLGNRGSVIYAWSSFAFDERRGWLVLYGGGHANYYGDELYIWKGDSGLWERGSLPSKVDFNDAAAVIISKDAPQSSHTYSNNVYLPVNDMFCTYGGAATPSGGPMQELVTADPRVLRRTGPWCFDTSLADPDKVGGGNGTGYDVTSLGTNAWYDRIDSIGSGTYPLGTLAHGGGATVTYQEGGSDVAVFTMDSGSGFPAWYKYVFGDIRSGGTDTITKIGVTSAGVMFDGWGVYDPVRQVMMRNAVRMSGTTSDIVSLHIPTGNSTKQVTGIQLIDEAGADFPLNEWDSGTSSWVRESHYGAAMDTDNDRLWLWRGDVDTPGRTYYVQLPAFDPVTGWASTIWTVHPVNPTGLTPRGNHIQGVLGKLRYVPALKSLIALDSTTITNVDDPGVWLFKTSTTAHVLTPASSAQGNAASTASISFAGELAPAAAAQANTSSTVSIVLHRTLTASPSTQTNACSTASAGQTHALSPANSQQGNTASTPSFSQTHSLSPATSQQGNTASTATLAQQGTLSPANCQQGNTSSAITIGRGLTLSPSNCQQGNVTAAGLVHIGGAFIGQPAYQANSSSQATISQLHHLVVANCAQQNKSPNRSLVGPTTFAPQRMFAVF